MGGGGRGVDGSAQAGAYGAARKVEGGGGGEGGCPPCSQLSSTMHQLRCMRSTCCTCVQAPMPAAAALHMPPWCTWPAASIQHATQHPRRSCPPEPMPPPPPSHLSCALVAPYKLRSGLPTYLSGRCAAHDPKHRCLGTHAVCGSCAAGGPPPHPRTCPAAALRAPGAGRWGAACSGPLQARSAPPTGPAWPPAAGPAGTPLTAAPAPGARDPTLAGAWRDFDDDKKRRRRAGALATRGGG